MTKQIVFGALLAMALFLVPGISHARWMNPATGRFQTIDSYEGNQEDPQSLHRYNYAQDDPVNMVDPSGREGELVELEVTEIAEADMDAAADLISGVVKREARKRIGTTVAKVTAATVGLLVLNGDDPSLELNSDLRLNPTGSTHAYQNYQCEPFANDAQTYFLSKGRQSQRITYDSYPGKTYLDFITAVEGFGIFGGQNISRNGHHEGILVEGQVYDNNVPFGVPRALWENGYQVVPNDKLDRVLTLRQANEQKYGSISPP